jgi:hypothetical protein
MINKSTTIIVLGFLALICTSAYAQDWKDHWRKSPLTSKNSNEWRNKPYVSKTTDNWRYSQDNPNQNCDGTGANGRKAQSIGGISLI